MAAAGSRCDNAAVRYRVYNVDRGMVPLATQAARADTFLTRFKGLLGRESLPPGEGLHITPCNGIHMFFMKFAIDAVFLGADEKVVKCIHAIGPWRTTRTYPDAVSVLELPAGTLAATGTQERDQLRFEPLPGN